MSLKARAASVYSGFVTPFFLDFNVQMSCQMQFSEFWHRQMQKASHCFFIGAVSSLLLSLFQLHPHLSRNQKAPLGVPDCLPGERCPDFSHDRSAPCRSEVHSLPLFKVTDCRTPNSPL